MNEKLLLDASTKATFTLNEIIYEQKGSVSIGSSLGPLLANIIMTELEDKIIKPLINDTTVTFYGRYVDETLHVNKCQDVHHNLSL